MGSQDPLPLSVPVYQILVALARGPAHGYALIEDIRERTGGEVDLTPSTLYGALHRMLDQGWIVEEAEEASDAGGPRRRVYGITEAGRDVARAEARRLHRAAAHAVDVRLLDASGLEPRSP